MLILFIFYDIFKNYWQEQDSNYTKDNIQIVAIIKEEKEKSIQKVSDQISITVQYHPISNYSFANPDTLECMPNLLFYLTKIIAQRRLKMI